MAVDVHERDLGVSGKAADPMSEPLARDEERRPHVEAEGVVFERRPVSVAHQETDEAHVRLVHLLLAARKAHPRGVDDGEVARHGVVKADEPVIEHLDGPRRDSLLGAAHPTDLIGRAGGSRPPRLLCKTSGSKMSLNGEMKTVVAACATVVCALVAVAPSAAAPAKRLPALTPVAHDALTRALERGELTEAQYALERARSLFTLGAVRREFGQVTKPSMWDATPILRDLAARLPDLSGGDRSSARAILSRPTDNFYEDEHHYTAPQGQWRSACDPNPLRPLCFHWVLTTRDAPPLADSDSDGIPDAVEETMTTFGEVYDLEVGTYGYRAPLSDTSSNEDGGNGKTDIYLADLGGDLNPFFGYCTTDDPNAFNQGYVYYDVSAYCVVDEDFANFGSSQTRQEFRDVTAAHEFFHAIQFSYDWFEDLWLMEGTAMFMEGQFRPNVEDRIRYLANSVLTSPGTPVDRGAGGF